MKVLDVKDLLLGIQQTSNQLNILKNQVKHVQMAIKEFISHEDSFKGDGGRSIINFYQESHLPFLLFFESWIEDYQSYLNSLENTIHDFESSPAGFIRQEFLENELQLGLRNTLQIASELTKEANEVIKTVSDIVPLPLLEDNRFIQASIHAQDSSRGTVEKLESFDHRETAALDPLLKNLDHMEDYIKKWLACSKAATYLWPIISQELLTGRISMMKYRILVHKGSKVSFKIWLKEPLRGLLKL